MNARVLVMFVTALWVSAALGQDSPEAIIEPVAHQGDPAPGIPGFTLVSVAQPEIDGAGNVLFLASLDGPGVEAGNDKALFYGPPGAVEKLIWESEPAPDTPEGVVIAELLAAADNISEGDDLEPAWIAFTAGVAGPGIEAGVNSRVLFVGPPGDFQRVLQAGDQAPGCEPGVTIAEEPFGGRLSDNATVYVSAELTGSGVPYDRACWLGTRDNLELVFRRGMQAPGCDEGVVFAYASSVVHNDAGQIAFLGYLDGVGVTGGNDTGRWLGGPGTLSKIAREGDPASDLGEDLTWSGVSSSNTTTNNRGDIGVCGYVQGPGITTDNDVVFCLGDSSGLHLIAQEGDPAPEAGPGVYMWAFGNCWLNDRAEAFYRVVYAGPGITEANRAAMYFGPFGAGRLTLRDGDPAPTFPPEITLWRVVAAPQIAALNDVGDVIVPTQIAGPGVTDDDKVVLWMRHHVLQRWVPLLRSGSNIGGLTLYAADEDDFAFGYCDQTGGADGMRQGLNDLGMLAIELQFTDGTEGVFRISPPVFGDGDEDGDVDLADWSLMAGCWTGPAGTVAPDCDLFDLDLDGDVDLADYRFFQRLFEGSEIQ